MMSFFKEWSNRLDAVVVARYLLLAELFFLFVSTSVAVIIETIIFLLFLTLPVLRGRVATTVRQPMVIMVLFWAAVVSIGLVYSVGPVSENIDIWKSWRKIFLVPMAAAVFDNEAGKRQLLWTFLSITMLAVLVSYGSWFLELALLKREPVPGIVIHNHATQGILFAVGAFAALLTLRLCPSYSYRWRWCLGSLFVIICANIIFITFGRSGYLVLLVFAILLPFFLGSSRSRFLFGVLPLAIGLALWLSPTGHSRIMQGVHELRTYRQASNLTSMGIRMVMWKNTLQVVMERPFFGYGTGGFVEGYRQQVEGGAGWQGQVVADPHNQFMRIAAEHGLAGLLVFIILLGAFSLQRVALPWRYLGLGVLLAWCASSLFSAHFSTFVEGRFLWLWCGAFLSSVGQGATQESIEC